MHRGFTVWFTGLSGAGKSTLSQMLVQRLRELGAKAEVLDGDVVRTHLSKGLGYSKEDRDENIRRIGFVCELLSRNGVVVIVAAISPYRSAREEVRSRIANFVEVYMKCPLEILVGRDAKGLYKRALAGEIPRFTGVSDPYEPPLAPELTVDSSKQTPKESLEEVWTLLENSGLISGNHSPQVPATLEGSSASVAGKSSGEVLQSIADGEDHGGNVFLGQLRRERER